MTAVDFNTAGWVPEEFDSEVIQRVNYISVVENRASREPMSTLTKSVPRSAGMDVEVIAKSGTYGEDATANDDIVLTAKKFGKALRVAEEDLNDSLANIIATKQRDWATSYGKIIDNACIAVTAGVGAGVPFLSLYKALLTTNSNTSYTASANYNSTAGGSGLYDTLSTTLGDVEEGDYYDESQAEFWAHPRWKRLLRGVKDADNRPIFLPGTAGNPGTPGSGIPDRLFGLPVYWGNGIKTSATATPNPSGNPLLVCVGSTDFARKGERSPIETMFIDGRTGLGALTDESILKMRVRRGWAVGHEKAFSVCEYTGT